MPTVRYVSIEGPMRCRVATVRRTEVAGHVAMAEAGHGERRVSLPDHACGQVAELDVPETIYPCLGRGWAVADTGGHEFLIHSRN